MIPSSACTDESEIFSSLRRVFFP